MVHNMTMLQNNERKFIKLSITRSQDHWECALYGKFALVCRIRLSAYLTKDLRKLTSKKSNESPQVKDSIGLVRHLATFSYYE